MRKDYLEEYLDKKQVILDSGVVIVYHRYKVSKTLGNCKVNKDDVIIKDMVKEYDSADAKEVINRFFDYVDTNVWCTVRSDNIRACKFYEKVGMEQISDIYWKQGELKGYIYLLRKQSLEKFMTVVI